MSCSTPRPIPTATAQNRFGAQRLMAAGTYWGQAIERAHRTSVERDTTTLTTAPAEHTPTTA